MGLFAMKEVQKNIVNLSFKRSHLRNQSSPTLCIRGTMIPGVSYVWLLADDKSGNVGRAFPNFI